MPQLFLDYEIKTPEATASFQVLEQCSYSRKGLGDSGQHEIMTCDCVETWDPKRKINLACSDDSGCINRVTSVECVHRSHGGYGAADPPSCGNNCQNQRFQKRQYAKVEVIQTERKGYGLRAEQDIAENQFVYEYVGEVIDEPTFRKRMIEYDTSHFKHFYFMMLKKDSFIDATVKGSLARFCNHSCNPNAYVDKWVVGDKLKMGIFAKRAIARGEEITFDYNVDRYGAQSQPCYCGEPNCLQFMGGKTQTDSALLLPEGISEALGVTPQQEKQWLKENKHLRSKQQSDDSIINEAFVNSIAVGALQTDTDVSRCMGALLKSQDKYIIRKLITRIHLTSSHTINSQIIRMHGYKTLSQLINQFLGDDELIVSMLEILLKWPKVTKNKISSSQIEDTVKALQSSATSADVKALSGELLKEWGALQMAYRIPKFKRDAAGTPGSESPAVVSRASRSRSPEKFGGASSGAGGAAPSEDTYGGGSAHFGAAASSTEAADAAAAAAAAAVVGGGGSGVAATDSPFDADSGVPAPADDEDLPDGWESTFDEASQSYYYFHRQLGLSRWDKPTRAIPKGPKVDPDGDRYNGHEQHAQSAQPSQGSQGSHRAGRYSTPPLSSKPNKHSEEMIAKREEERLQRERERQFKDLRAKENLLQQFIVQSQREAEEKRALEEKLKKEQQERKREKHKRRQQQKSSSSAGSSSSTTTTTSSSSKSKSKSSGSSSWTHLFAKTVPNLIKKFESEIGHDNVKQCAREIVHVLVEKEVKKSSAPPKELDKHKVKKIDEFSKSYMEKFLVKYRSKKRKAGDAPDSEKKQKV